MLDPQTGSTITSFTAPSASIDGLAYIEPFLYASDFSFSQIYKLNPENGSILQTLFPQVSIGGGLDGGEDRLFASDFSLNIYELNPDNGSLINSFQTQQVTYGIGFTGERIFTSVPGFGIDEYDPNTGQFIRTLSSTGYSALAGGGNPDAEWLTETPNLVTIPAGGNAEINITVSANELSIGQYSAQIVLESNDPDSTTLTIPVTLDIITGVGNEEELPKSYSLHQNYPNPFNPATTIKYELPKEVYVVLTVYNILGQEVETLVNSVQQAGRYEIYWDASDLASGFYIYRIEAGDFVEAKKLILMK
ncbi:MAG: T9SS type A sorting domain-containing protein [Ignavibacteria bacterium]|nr:T9SS type A sorting domain-containing protein [Ignavibacteria bacterium]